jgi:GH25 family lysozyme M1 (1,4-beta-N-acetylmuramidase)
MGDEREILVRKSTLKEEGNDSDLSHFTSAERMAMVWPLTVAAWAMKGIDVSSMRLQRDVERVVRRRR